MYLLRVQNAKAGYPFSAETDLLAIYSIKLVRVRFNDAIGTLSVLSKLLQVRVIHPAFAVFALNPLFRHPIFTTQQTTRERAPSSDA